ncbi:uncharacterized protein LOC109538238 [Dendroctonus ponderosae]|uniref:Uncharacterized protein n=2 Tax=Dendroctonus ponderosae TaxID=77166 RepID=A0AAR5PIR7_DENPD|nr:uncharacterized protein LOC109538238 [Dendroctonus ponderosae]KAH1015925.1 hypothetical protein HUJ04_007235 [Dendroctonus ponderosae]
MCLKFLSVALLCLSSLEVHSVPLPKDKIPTDSELIGHRQANDQRNAATKYFQDMYVAQNNPKEIEFGHVAENPKNWEQRFEKINLENLNHQGKVRWGDKNGGYGEHYWDLNHAGQSKELESNGNESQQSEKTKINPDESQKVLRQNLARTKRNPDEDVEFISDEAKSSILDDKAPKHGGNYRRAKDFRQKREELFAEDE